MTISRRGYRQDARGIKRRASVEALEERKLLAAAGLVAAYAFDEGAGGAVADASGAGNGGTISNATWTVAGKFGSALSFNGANAVVNVADSASLDLTGGMTLEAWVRPTSQAGYRTVVMKDVPGELAYALYGSGDTNRPNTWTRIGATSYDATGPAALPLNVWTHLAATYNGTALVLYVNGAQVASRAVTGSIQTSTNPFHVGGNPVWGEYWAGQIDEVRVYNRALSGSEVQADMNAPVGAPPAPDTAAPTVTLSAPADASRVSGNVQISAAAGDNVGVAGVQFKLDGSNLGAEDTTAPYAVTWNADAAGLGGHTLTAVARDAAGNLTTSAPVGVAVVDVTPPAAALTAPPPGTTVAGSVTVTASASDARGVAGVQFLLDGNPLGPEDTAAPYAVTWDSTASPGGAHRLTALARDGSGNTTTSAPVDVTVDNRVDSAPPTVDVTSPAPGATVTGTVAVTASAADDIGVVGVQFRLDGTLLGAEDLSAPYSVAWNAGAAVPGAHTLTAVARDAAGRSTTSQPIAVTVADQAAPAVAVTSPAAGSSVSGTVTVAATASDNVAVAGVRFLLDGVPLGAEDTAAPYSVAWDTSTSAVGAHTLTAIARDAAGNNTTSAAVTVSRVDPNAASFYYLSLTGGGTITGSTGPAVTFTDADILRLTVAPGGQYDYRMFFDGSDVGLTTTSENVDAFAVLADGTILVSTVGFYSVPGPAATTLSGAGEDLLKFTPTSAGASTAGTWSVYFDGSDVGLTGTSATIDALGVLPDGRVLVSLDGEPYAITGGPTADDEDVLAFTPSSLGATTAGSWSVYFDGTDVGLSTTLGEDVDALYVRVPAGGGNPQLSFSTRDVFAVPGVSGTNHDVFTFTPTTLGDTTAGTFGPGMLLTGSSYGLTAFDLDGFSAGLAASDDAVAPTVAVSAPAPGATVRGPVSLSAVAGDNVAVAGVQFLLNGSPIGTEVTAAPYTLLWNSAGVADGNYVLSARARDALGNTTTSATVGFSVKNADTTAPTVSVTAPADGATAGGVVSVTASASDDVAVAGVQFLLDGQPLGQEDATAPYAISWDTSAAGNGRHVLTARARDASGNTATSGAVGVVVYNAGRLVIDSPSGGASVPAGTVAVTYHVAGDLSEYDHVRFTLDNGTELADVPADGTFSFGGVAPGSHVVNGWLARADGTAIAGSAASAVTITVLAPDTQPPAVSLTAPAANATVSATVTLAATATDSAGVTGVQFQVDGVNLGAPDTAAPYSVSWNTAGAANGLHVLTAIATDTAGNTSSDSRTVTVSNGVNLSINGAVRYQTIDGLGVNLGATAWKGGQVKPWIDKLVDDMGASLFRVIIESVSGWEDVNDNADPFTADWGYYNALYATPKFTDLWNTIAYLNTKNVRVLLNVMGTVPGWMGGTVINAAAEDEFVEMETSMLYYAVNTAHLHIDDLSILNEQDAGSPEGPSVNPTQYARLVNRIVSRMTGMGLTDIGIVGGETANGYTSYNDVLYADATVMPYVKHLAFHNYFGSNGSFDSDVKNSGWPGRNWWVTEYADAFFSGDGGAPVPNEWTFSRNSFQNLISHVSGGASGAAVYDGIDALYQHHNFQVNSLGQIGWNPTTNVYSVRKRFYANGMLYKFVRPGTVRIDSSTTRTGLVQVAFYNPASGQVSIVGRNSNSTPITIVGSLGGGLSGSIFQLFQTDSGSLNMTRGADVRISGGQYSVTIPADTIFALATPTDVVPPTAPTGLTVSGNVGSASLQWSAATDDVAVTSYNVYRSTTSGFMPSAANRIGQSTGTSFTDVVPPGTYYYVVVAVDGAGNLGPSSNEAGGEVAADGTAPSVVLTAPASGAIATGIVTLAATASDDVGVAGVQFLLDGSPIGAEDAVAPYSLAWNSALTANGDHTVAARARDAAGNVTTSAVATVTVSNAPSVPGLVAYYSFDEGAGTSAGDSSGKGNNGAIVGAAWTAAGKYGSALVFNGSGNVVNVPDSNSLDLTTGMTIEAWVRPSVLGGYRTVVMKDLPSELSYALYASGDTNRPGAWGRVSASSASSTSVIGPTALALNVWTHVAATYNGSSFVFYVNGAQVATTALTGALLTSANPLHIGGNAVWGEYFAGAIDEVRVYNVALTAAQIQADMNGSGGAPAQAQVAAAEPVQTAAVTLMFAAPDTSSEPLVWKEKSGATAELRTAGGARTALNDSRRGTSGERHHRQHAYTRHNRVRSGAADGAPRAAP